MPALGLVLSDITINSEGSIVILGSITAMNTSSYTLDDPLYIDPTTAGDLTTTRPIGSNQIQAVARVTRVNASQGTIFIAGAMRSNAIPNFTAADKFWYGSTDGVQAEGSITSAGRDILDDANAAAQRTTLGLVIGTNVLAEQTIGIANDNLVEVDDADAADNDFARFTANGLEGRSYAEVRADLSLEQADLKPTEHIILACSDETSDLATGVAKLTFRMPYAFTLSEVKSSVTTAPVGATLTVDINDGGVSIMTTNKLDILTTATIDDGTATLTDTAIAEDAVVTVDIDTVGSGTAGAGLKVTLIGYRT